MDAPGRYDIIASCNVNGTGSQDSPQGSVYPNSGVPGVVTARSAVGVYTATLPGGGVPEAECVVVATPIDDLDGATPQLTRPAAIVHTSDTVKTIRFFDEAGAAADRNFALTIIRSRKKT